MGLSIPQRGQRRAQQKIVIPPVGGSSQPRVIELEDDATDLLKPDDAAETPPPAVESESAAAPKGNGRRDQITQSIGQLQAAIQAAAEAIYSVSLQQDDLITISTKTVDSIGDCVADNTTEVIKNMIGVMPAARKAKRVRLAARAVSVLLDKYPFLDCPPLQRVAGDHDALENLLAACREIVETEEIEGYARYEGGTLHVNPRKLKILPLPMREAVIVHEAVHVIHDARREDRTDESQPYLRRTGEREAMRAEIEYLKEFGLDRAEAEKYLLDSLPTDLTDEARELFDAAWAGKREGQRRRARLSNVRRAAYNQFQFAAWLEAARSHIQSQLTNTDGLESDKGYAAIEHLQELIRQSAAHLTQLSGEDFLVFWNDIATQLATDGVLPPDWQDHELLPSGAGNPPDEPAAAPERPTRPHPEGAPLRLDPNEFLGDEITPDWILAQYDDAMNNPRLRPKQRRDRIEQLKWLAQEFLGDKQTRLGQAAPAAPPPTKPITKPTEKPVETPAPPDRWHPRRPHIMPRPKARGPAR